MDDADFGPDPVTQAALRLVPKVGPVMAQFRVDRFEQQQRRVEQLSREAGELMELESLFEAIASDPRLADMFDQAVASAVQSSSDSKIRLLGRALASGALAKDDAAVDEAQEILRVAGQLEAIDIRALLFLPGREGRQAFEGLLQKTFSIGAGTAQVVIARLNHLGLIDQEQESWINDVSDREDDSVVLEKEWVKTDAANAILKMLAENA